MIPTMRPIEADDEHADDERADARIDPGQQVVADGLVGPVGQVQEEDGADEDPDGRAQSSARTIRPRRDAHGDEDAGHRDRDESQEPVEDAPAHRAEDPLPEEQRGADDDDADGRDDEGEGDRSERRDLGDLAADGGRLGLRQLDVGHDQPVSPPRGSTRTGRAGPVAAAAWEPRVAAARAWSGAARQDPAWSAAGRRMAAARPMAVLVASGRPGCCSGSGRLGAGDAGVEPMIAAASGSRPARAVRRRVRSLDGDRAPRSAPPAGAC